MKTIRKTFISACLLSLIFIFAAFAPIGVKAADATIYDISDIVEKIGARKEYEMKHGVKEVSGTALGYGDTVKFAYKERSDKNTDGHYSRTAFGIGSYGFYFYHTSGDIQVRICNMQTDARNWDRSNSYFDTIPDNTFRTYGADDQIVNYTIENKDTITVPTVPAREHYTGEWNEFTLNFDNEQVITAKYTATRYTVTFKADGETVATETYTVENKTVNEPAVPAKKGYDGAWSKYELNFENIEVTAEYTFGKAAGFSVSLAGDIGLNFYATLSADTGEMTAQVTFKGETVTVKGVKTDKVAGNAFVFRFPVAPKDYKENVAFVVTTLGGDTITATSSVKEYADKFAEGEDGYALVQKMLAYCEAARVYFAAETVNTARDFTADLTAFAATVSGTDDDITVEGATLVLEDTTEIKLYFTCADLTGKTFKVGNSEVTPEAVTGVENCYVLRLKNIVMKDIDELYDFTLGGKTVRYGALSYVKATLEDKDTSISLGNLVKALYELNVAANAYFAA